jgi:uncharacterized protein (DUF302 family)
VLLYFLCFTLAGQSSVSALLDDFRRDIKERLDPGQSYGLYQKSLEIEADFDEVCERIETNISQSEWKLITHWELNTPEICSSRARVYLIQNQEYDEAVLAKGARHLVFLPIRIGVFNERGKVVVVFTNPELLSKVFFANLPFAEQDEMIAYANVVRKDLVTLCVKGMEGTILTEQLPPVRNDRDVRFFWSKYQDQLDIVKRVPIRHDPQAALQKVCERIERAAARLKSGWLVVSRTLIGKRACILGVTQRNIEDQLLNYSGLKWPSSLDRDPCSGLYHLTQFPLEILVFIEEGEVRVALLDQFWRMRFYLWDDPYRTGSIFLARDPNLSSRIYSDLLEIIKSP